jgi:2-alkyl-3-oxoalkanoate reductase
MRVFVTGASGAIGTRLVPQLIDAGHEVIGTVHSPGNAKRVRALGAKPVALDLLDAGAEAARAAAANGAPVVRQSAAPVSG